MKLITEITQNLINWYSQSEEHGRLLSTKAVAPSGEGIYSGVDVLHQPISLFFVQATIIIGLCRFLGLGGKYLKQPSVIFEIVAGIILGPSALCRHHYFQEVIFPKSSLSNLQIVATIGLTFYLFTVGLELDMNLLKTHFRKTSLISIAGIAIPFAVGIGISGTLKDVLQPESEASFTSFFVFIGTAMSITAFPVLARMLREGGLIYTRPGSMALGAAAVDDAIAWTLLALSIAIANGGDMNQAGYIFATVILIAGFSIFIMKPILEFVVEYAEVHNVTIITHNLFALMICLLFMFAWITEFIGLDTIFGAFLFGLAVPRGTRLFHQCNEYIEQFVLTFTLPLYFALSGLKTDITTISSNKDGAMVVLVCVLASAAKFSGVGAASYFSGLSLRESTVIAALMNTRGLVELIVLNVGLNAGILNTRTFSVMVLMAVFTTFMTSPVVELVFPEHLRKEILGETDEKDTEMVALKVPAGKVDFEHITNRLGVVVEYLPQMQPLVNLLSYFIPYHKESELTASIMHFNEPTKSDLDKFIGLNEEGRLIRVDEEPTDMVQAMKLMEKDASIKKPELLPISSFCNAYQVPVNAFRIEGDPVEYPLELKNLALNNDCSLLVIPFKPDSAFAERLFWKSLRLTPAPILLLADIQPIREKPINVDERPRARTRGKSITEFPKEFVSDLEAGISSATDGPTLFSSVSPDAFPIHRRGSVTNHFQKITPSARKDRQIVILLLGLPADLVILSLIPRFLENHANIVTLLLPENSEVLSKSVHEQVKHFKETKEIQVREIKAFTNDFEAIIVEINKFYFDLFITSYLEPQEDPALRLEATEKGFSSLLSNVPGFSSSNQKQDYQAPPERGVTRMYSGMPDTPVFAALEYPKLGIIGSKLYSQIHSHAALIAIIHEPDHIVPMTPDASMIVADQIDLELKKTAGDIEGTQAIEKSHENV